MDVCLLSTRPQLETRSTTQACALTGNQTSGPLILRLALNPLSHTSSGKRFLPIFAYVGYSYVEKKGTHHKWGTQ